jgi:AraC-like DNA-binding protein
MRASHGQIHVHGGHAPPASVLRQLRPAGSAVRAGAFLSSEMSVDTDWHHHELHQLIYAFDGRLEVESAAARYLLPPQLMAWIPAGLPHRTQIHWVRSGSVFFEPAMIADGGDRIRILKATGLMRELMELAMRWPIRAPEQPMGRSFFETLAHLCGEWLQAETALHLPTARDPQLAAAMRYTQTQLADASFAGACRAAGLSARSLRRRFEAEAGMSWLAYRQRHRLLTAMAMLEAGRAVGQVAADVGFDSPSAFAKAFAALLGESPAQYRRRVYAGRPSP